MFFVSLSSLVLLLPDFQAGGGGSFGGGGGGGGGFGGGGGDGEGLFYLLYWLVRFAIEYPAVGVPLLIVVVAVFLYGARAGWWKHEERTIRRARPQRRARVSDNAVAELRRRDPDFDRAKFFSRVAVAFHKAQDSWCAQDLEPIRAFVSDGVFERFSLQIESQIDEGWRQGMSEVHTEPFTIVHVASGRHFDTVTVRIPFQAEIFRVHRDSGDRVEGSELPRRAFAECWGFVRRRGAKSLTGGGLIEGKCPNCGAPLAMNQSARCTSCEAHLRSGQYDWVLAEITQASEWRPEVEAAVAGLERYAEGDPGLNVQLLEDHASVAFWRWSAAARQGRVDPLVRIATPEFCAEYGAGLSSSKEERTYLGDRAVGSVRILGLLAGAARDRAVIEVVWDGRPTTVDETGRRDIAPDRRRRRSLLVLGRRAGEQTSVRDTFTATHCRNCGAPDPGGTDPLCSYCEAPRTGDAATWLLQDVLGEGTPATRELHEELRNAAQGEARAAAVPSAAGLLAWAVTLAKADGHVDERERRAVHALGARHEATPEQVDAMLAGTASEDTGPVPRDEAEAEAWLGALVELALADGTLRAGEAPFLRHATHALGLPRRTLDRLLQEKRKELYREARAALKVPKG